MSLDKATREAELLKNYIRKCPYISTNSPFVGAALSGVDQLILASECSDHSCCSSSSSASSVSHELGRCRANEVPVKHIPSAKQQSKSRVPTSAFRIILLDVPLMLLFVVCVFTLWVHRVHDLYLVPEREAMVWTDERKETEMTYYARTCDADDLTTKNGRDLVLDENATPKDAYEHQLQHGFTVFPRVLSEKTATELRNHVVERNRKLKPSESIFVIENENRYSLALGTEEPSVANAMMELATNEHLSQAMEAIMGESPTTIEMSIVASSYGAVDQFWHSDVQEEGSALRYARAFGPAYSVFIQLQNTTKAMGSTAICPGSHVCSAGNTKDLCKEEGFQFVSEDGYWRQGDALLMNMDSYHRGAAHTDPDGPDRVMLVMTFVPKPRSRSESRKMPLGIPYSQRWDMWGHTLKDFATAKTAMWWPLCILRALGLYKPKNAEWGIDFVSGALMRIANESFGFKRSDLEAFLEGDERIWWFPKFLYGQVKGEESWPEFILNTIKRCEIFALVVNIAALSVYLSLYLYYLVLSWWFGAKTEQSRKRRFGWALFRLVVTHGTVYLVFIFANRHVDQTEWAVDIRAGRIYSSPYGNFDNDYDGPTTLPWRADVLIETRYESEYLAMYTDFVRRNHPGNRKWNALLSDGIQSYASYGGLPLEFRNHISEFIVGSIENEQGRFLYQRSDGAWIVMSFDDAVRHTRKEMQLQSNPILNRLNTELGFLISECRVGSLRDTALAKKFTLPLLKSMRQQLVNMEPLTKVPVNHVRVETRSFSLQGNNIAPFHRTFQMPVPKKMERHVVDRRVELNFGDWLEEPVSGAWLQEGDDVEGIHTPGDKGKIYSYRGIIENVTSSGKYNVLYADGDRGPRHKDRIRMFEPYHEDEAVEVRHNGDWQVCRILSINNNGKYSVALLDDDETVLENIHDGRIRRRLRRHQLV